MEPKGGTEPMVWVKDNAGNQFLCSVKELKDPNSVSEEEKKNCIDDARMAFTRND